VHLQDDDFLDREMWDFANTPPRHYPLLLHYHPLVIYRHQVIKQADVVLATFLLGEHFTYDETRRIFDYYDPLTTGDSSLSGCIQSIMAAEIGHAETAYRYFADALAMDLGDVDGNVREGLHIASLGGTWMALVHGFAGLRDHAGRLRFCPRLPEGWIHLRFQLRVRDTVLEVEIVPDAATYRVIAGDALEIEHEGRSCTIKREAVRLPVEGPPPAPAMSNGQGGNRAS
jgi:alpha,alpha-trehalose phosphorylase